MGTLTKQSKTQLMKVLISTTTGNLGSGVLTFIIGLLILRETNSALSFGISQVVGPVVALLLLPFTGSMVDRFNRKKIIIYAQLLSVFSLALYSIYLYYQGFNHLIVTYLLLGCLKISDQFLTTAYTASVVQIVLEEDIQRLKSFQQMIGSLLAIMAPLLGAMLLDILPLLALVWIEILLEIMTMIVVCLINFQFVRLSNAGDQEASSTSSILEMFHDGLVFVKKSRKLIFALFFSMLINFVFGIVTVGLPFIQIQLLHFSNTIYGLTEAIFSFGMIVSALALSLSKTIKIPLFHSWKMISAMGSLFFFLGILLLFPLEQLYFIIGIACFNFLAGTLMTQINVPVTIWLTQEIPNQLQGRVFNLMNTGAQLLSPIGILTFSGLFDVISGSLIFVIAGITILFITLLYPLCFKVDLRTNKL
ncbi:MFS transporter [Listeria kieliensis]